MYIFLTLPLKSNIKLSSCYLRGGWGRDMLPKDGFKSPKERKSWQASSLFVPRTVSYGHSRFLFTLDLFGLDVGNTNWRMTSFYISLEAVQNLLKSPKKQITASFFPLDCFIFLNILL